MRQDQIAVFVGGRYEVLGLIATGGMGEVHEARDTVLDRPVALKVMRGGDASFLDRFRREATNAARLQHPNIVQVYDFGQDPAGSAYMAMERIDGQTLRELLSARGRLPSGLAARIGAQVCQALEHAHRAGVLHRDVKPENIFITPEGEAKVFDFGLSRALAESGATQGGQLFGTPHYLAPEQVEGGTADARADIYSLGIVLFEMLTGRPPFTGDSPAAVAMRRIAQDVPFPSELDPGLPKELDWIVGRATARRPGDRYAGAAAMGAALSAVRDPEAGTPRGIVQHTAAIPLEAEPTIRLPRGTRTARRRRRMTLRRFRWVALAVVLTMMAGAVPFAVRALQRMDVPDVTGLSRATAARAIQAAGLDARVDFANHDRVPQGAVIRTVPPAGTSLRRGSDVSVVVSLGPVTVNVPDMRGKDARAARRTLEDRGFRVALRRVFHATVPKGRVVGQDPDPGVLVRDGSTITLRISQGPERIEVPKVVGRDEFAARRILEDAGFEISAAEEFADAPRGEVVEQSPEPGQEVAKGTRVRIVVSKGPPPVAVPNLRCMSRNQARETLAARDLKISFEGSGSRVVDQDPTPGGKIPRGSTVTAFLGAGAYC